MGIFTKPEVVILKGTSDAQAYLEKLELLQKKAEGTALEQIQKEIAITKQYYLFLHICHLIFTQKSIKKDYNFILMVY